MTHPNDRLCALADSLPAAIRWRYCDYEELLRKQLEMMLEPDALGTRSPRGAKRAPRGH
jgi:hypothetical protein